MAFQANSPFFAFLTNTAGRATLAESAPAENFILEERLSDERHQDFLQSSGFDTTPPADVPTWFAQHFNYTTTRIARRGAPTGTLSATFETGNRRAWLSPNSAMDVVRVETLEGLCNRSTSLLSASDAEWLIQQLLSARDAGQAPRADVALSLRKWLLRIAGGSDSRPVFVAPFAEVEPILAQPDWANRLRDALGLGHIRAIAGRPTRVLHMRYGLERVRRAHLTRPDAWASAPTVLDDVARSGPNPHFFPAPESTSQGFGFTVDLDPANPVTTREFLHAPIPYLPEDIARLGLVTADVTDPQVTGARSRHRTQARPHLRHFKDLPTRP